MIQAILGFTSLLTVVGIAYGSLKTTVDAIKKSQDEMKQDFKEMKERLIITECRVENLCEEKTTSSRLSPSLKK